MEIQYYGANCVRITDKKIRIVTDDNLNSIGLKSVTAPDDVGIFTLEHSIDSKSRFTIDTPGEYEISEVSIRGIPARRHIDSEGFRSTMYSIHIDGISIGIVGHIYPELSDEQLELMGVIDILVIPVGGNGYTLDSIGATQIIKKIEPKIVIPTHFADNNVKYEVPQSELSEFINQIGATDFERLDSLKVKGIDLGDKTQVVALNRVTVK